jgi:hypothetical protein
MFDHTTDFHSQHADNSLWMRLASETKLLALDADKHGTSASVSHSEYALFL